MTQTVTLEEIEPRDGLAVLVQGSDAPVFRGWYEGGATYLCGGCGRVIAENASDGDLYDIAFRCGQCGALSMGPRLPPGRPLPWPGTVVLDPGAYLIGGTVEGRENVVLASREAADRVLKETGAGTALHLPNEVGQDPDVVGPELLTSLVDRTAALVGDDFRTLMARFERGQTRKPPAKNPHRLMELAAAAREAAESFRSGAPAIDAVATVELHVTLEQLDRWANHPQWEALLPSLKSPEDFPHLLMTLTTASFLTDAGNAVELVATSGVRSPDLRLHLGARSAVAVEVKTPQELRRPKAPLSAEVAGAVLDRALSSAGSGKGGQLGPEMDGVLAIGCFGLRDADLETIGAAAEVVLNRRPTERSHVLGIAIFSLGVLLESRPVGIGKTATTLNGILGARIVENGHYAGSHRVSSEGTTALRPIETPTHELAFGAGAIQYLGPSSSRPGTGSGGTKIGRNDPCWCGSGRKFKKCHGGSGIPQG